MKDKIKQSEIALNNLDMAVSLVQLNRQEHNQLMFDIKFLKDFIKELTIPKEDGKD